MLLHHCHRLNAALELWVIDGPTDSKQLASGFSLYCWALCGIHLLPLGMSLICYSTRNRLSIIKTSVMSVHPNSSLPVHELSYFRYLTLCSVFFFFVYCLCLIFSLFVCFCEGYNTSFSCFPYIHYLYGKLQKI